jgi:hypothetical protein
LLGQDSWEVRNLRTAAPVYVSVVRRPPLITEKLLYVSEVLGGLHCVSIQLTSGTLPHSKLRHAIELLDTGIARMAESPAATFRTLI